MTDASTLTLAALEQADAAALRRLWKATKSTEPPKTFTARLMRLALAWEVQAARAAGEMAQTQRAWRRIIRGRSGRHHLNKANPGLATSAANGTRILKKWGGATHEVLIKEGGAVIWNGQSYTSLSAVARAMTGTNRNGPKFFGLRESSKP